MRIDTDRMVLTLPPPQAAPAVLDYFQRNRAHLAPWEPARDEGFFTEAWWVAQLAGNRQQFADGRSLRLFGEVRTDPGRIVASISLSNIVRGAFEACHLGYSIDGTLQGQGLMREAVDAVVDHAFDALGLHRVMANYIPTNTRSAGLLRALGFTVEGYARDYLKIDGVWQDHILTSRTAPLGSTAEAHETEGTGNW